MKNLVTALKSNAVWKFMPQIAALLCCLCAISQASASWNGSANPPALVQIKSTLEDRDERAAPEVVAPAVYGDIEFVVIHFPLKGSKIQNGGYIEARNKNSGKKLWGVQVYTTNYDKQSEQDVQDVFITEVTVDEQKRVLIVKDERNRRYMVDIETQQVAQLPTKRAKPDTEEK